MNVIKRENLPLLWIRLTLGFVQFLDPKRSILENPVALISMVPSPASMIKAWSPGCKRAKKPALYGDYVADLEVFTRLGMDNEKLILASPLVMK